MHSFVQEGAEGEAEEAEEAGGTAGEEGEAEGVETKEGEAEEEAEDLGCASATAPVQDQEVVEVAAAVAVPRSPRLPISQPLQRHSNALAILFSVIHRFVIKLHVHRHSMCTFRILFLAFSWLLNVFASHIP